MKTQDPADLRAELARHQVPIYVVAPSAGIHPRRLGRMLRGVEPMPSNVARRIEAALKEQRR